MGNAYDRYEYEAKDICAACGYVRGSAGCTGFHDHDADVAAVPFPARRAMQDAIWTECIAPHNNEWTTWSDSILLAECAASALVRAGWRVVAADDDHDADVEAVLNAAKLAGRHEPGEGYHFNSNEQATLKALAALTAAGIRCLYVPEDMAVEHGARLVPVDAWPWYERLYTIEATPHPPADYGFA